MTQPTIFDRCLQFYTDDPLLQMYVTSNAVHMALTDIVEQLATAGADYDAVDIIRTRARQAYSDIQSVIQVDHDSREANK